MSIALISEVSFDIERLAKQVAEDKRCNPSNYAMVVISEGASMLGGQLVEYGQEDAYGHRKLGGIGQITGEALKQLTGIDIHTSRCTATQNNTASCDHTNIATQTSGRGIFK
jgi:6-phosphofructokinase